MRTYTGLRVKAFPCGTVVYVSKKPMANLSCSNCGNTDAVVTILAESGHDNAYACRLCTLKLEKMLGLWLF